MNIVCNTVVKGRFGTYELDTESGGYEHRLWEEDAPVVVPGFVDLHIHGGFGVDFMRATRAEMLTLCDRLAACGYEGFLPSTVTAGPEDVQRALDILPDHPMVLGFHLEGPFISPRYPGAQPKEFISGPGAEGWEKILDDPRLRYITLAPELDQATELIERLVRRGVVVSMGHTDATFDQVRRGFEAGATNTTHTFNAMRPLHHREAGTVGFALLEDGLNCELIYDRHHVSREAAAVLVRCKPPERLVAVSDGTFAIGMPPGQMVRMWGMDCVIGAGQVRLKDGTLAGSAITLLDAFRNLWEDFGPEVAIRACSVNPRRILGLPEMPKIWLRFEGRDSFEILPTDRS
ncbi:MAG TPA: amidohydrolase family protein [Fimbriimonas sp.]